MKREIFLTHFLAGVLAFLLSLCAAGCMVTAFDLPTAHLAGLTMACGLFALLGTVGFRLRWGGPALLALTLLAAAAFWRFGSLTEQVQALVYHISFRYHGAYGTPVLGSYGAPMDIPLGAVSLIVALTTARTVCRRKPVAAVLLALALPVGCCVVVTDTVPDSWCIFGLMFGFGMLWLTDWSRRQGASHGNRLVLYGAVPLLAALIVLFASTPEKSYVNRVEEYEERLVLWAEKLMGVAQEAAESITAGTTDEAKRVDLASVGPRYQWNAPVMDVTAPVSGTLYLREQDYVTYSGTGWTATRHRTERFCAEGTVLGQMEIETYGKRSVRFVPYYPQEEVILAGGCLRNDSKSSYSYTLMADNASEGVDDPEEGISDLLVLAGAVSSRTDSQYKQLPTDTLRWAKELAEQITGEEHSTAGQAAAIGDYVRSSARYDLDTRRMNGGTDFARWFLEESDTGYCVHFATAATVLLRAAGIPARYVEGYMFQCQPGEKVTVTGKAAHAWVEYYDGGLWRILEATPADLSQTEQQTESRPAEETETVPASARPETTPPAAPETGIPAPGDAPPEQKPEEPRTMPGWISVLLWLAAAAGGLAAQSQVRIWLKERSWNRGTPNTQALNRWAQVRQLARLTGLSLPGELEELAQKAKFSQHSLTEEELARFEDFRCRARKMLSEGPGLRRWALRLVFGIK